MKKYDLIVIGSGAGMNVAANAVAQGMKVAVVDSGPLGGTCLNRGCIPSKVMLYPADVIRTIEDAKAIGVHATIEKVDFDRIMKRTWQIVLDDRHQMENGIRHSEQLDFYNVEGRFIAEYTMQVGKKQIKADRIVIASGARPSIPPIEGLEEAGYLTSATVFDLKTPPKSLIVVGGGYIAVEFAHFFSAIGVEVTIVGRNARLVPQEEPEISDLLQRKMSRHMQVYTGYEARSASVRGWAQDESPPSNRATAKRSRFAAKRFWSPPGGGRTPTSCTRNRRASRPTSGAGSWSTSICKRQRRASGRWATPSGGTSSGTRPTITPRWSGRTPLPSINIP